MASGDQADTSQKPKKAKPKKLSQKEQSERFIETARKIGTDDNGVAFDAAVRLIIRPLGVGVVKNRTSD